MVLFCLLAGAVVRNVSPTFLEILQTEQEVSATEGALTGRVRDGEGQMLL